MAGEGYRTAQVGFLAKRELTTRANARDDLVDKLRAWGGPFQGSRGHDDDWGASKPLDDIVRSAFHYIDTDNPLGLRFKIRQANDKGMPTFVVQHAFEADGGEVIDAGLSQLGVRYVFADMDPLGPAGGAGSGFDCSGLVCWCYQQVGVTLPHQSEAIRLDPRTIRFDDQGKCRRGDLVIMWFPNTRGISPGHASHIGMWVKPGMMLDTRNPISEPVGIRPIELGSVVTFGRIRSVNGPLAA